MSRELANAFFERDLTPAEADALEASLESSPEAAEALLAAAEASYRATGLPEPRWSARRPGLGRLSKGWMVAALLLGGGALFALKASRTSARVYDVAEAEGDMPVVEAVQADIRALDAAPDAAAPAPVADAAESAPAEDASRKGSRLGVVLRLKEAQSLKVQVYDAQGRAVRTLFDGRAEAGERRYEWDGLNGQGSRLAGGDYEVRVSGPGIALTRPLKLRSQAR